MTAIDLVAWRTRLGLTQARAAELLDLSPRGYRNYEYGTRPVPHVVALACKAIEAGLVAV